MSKKSLKFNSKTFFQNFYGFGDIKHHITVKQLLLTSFVK